MAVVARTQGFELTRTWLPARQAVLADTLPLGILLAVMGGIGAGVMGGLHVGVAAGVAAGVGAGGAGLVLGGLGSGVAGGAVGPLTNVYVRNLLLMITASLLLAACAQASFTVPFSTGSAGDLVPITGQTFGVLLIGVTLGSRRAFGAVFLYLMWGWAGAPFFAGGGAGFTALFTGASAGYLWGFVLAAVVVGFLAERGFDRGNWLLAAMLAGNALIYVVGLPVLELWGNNNGFDLNVWNAGLWPFVPGDMLKLIAAANVVAVGWWGVRLLEARRSPRPSARRPRPSAP